MIRVDEIYYNVFAAAMQHRDRVGLHWFDPFGSTDIKDLCNVPPVDGVADLRIVFWDQEPVYLEQAKVFFEEFTKDYLGPTLIVTSERSSESLETIKNTYHVSSDYYFFHGWAALDWYRGYDHTYLYQPFHDRQFRHAFINLNNIVGGNRSHRIRLLSELAKRDIVKNNLISFPAVCPYEKQSVQDLARNLALDLSAVDLPLIVDHGGNHANQSHSITIWPQAQECFAHVVTETVYTSDRLHLTEKTFKPIVMQQPFLLVAPRGSLAYLKEYGFQTFDMLWDETYDQLDDQSRIDAVADICQKISSWTGAELQDAAAAAKDAVMYNHQWFYGGFQHLLWDELTAMVSRW